MVETTINKVQYDCDGVETDFDFTFKIFNKTDIRVIIADTDGVETELTYITDFSVHAINNNFTSGGTVTTVATYSSEYTITIIREVELTQESDYVENESHPAAVYENDLDKLTMMVQQLEEKLNRALLVPVSDEAVSLEIPPIPSRTSRYAAYDAEGSPIAVTPIGGTVPVTAFMETLLDDETAAAGRTTLDVYSQDEIDTAIETEIATAINLKGLLAIVIAQTGTAQPTIAAGGVVEINGVRYTNPLEVAITGTTADTTWYDILLTPSGTTFTASFVARRTGVWSDSKQGLYSGNNRVVGCTYRIASDNWVNNNVLVVINKTIDIVLDIPGWNMDTTAGILLPHGLSLTDITDFNGIIHKDDGTTAFPLHYRTSTPDGSISFTLTNINLIRDAGGVFDSVDYNDDTILRGRVFIKYKV
jgi:hypothetical protein